MNNKRKMKKKKIKNATGRELTEAGMKCLPGLS
jgi:hypothetical protein